MSSTSSSNPPVSPTTRNEPPAHLTPEQLTQSTAQLFRSTSSSPEHHGDFKEQRRSLDWEYHLVPSKERQLLQDEIVSSVLKRAHRECVSQSEPERQDHPSMNGQDRPLALFTAGGMGAGKGHTLRNMLMDRTIVLPKDFVWVDPDSLARELPEREQYLRNDPKKASEKLHPEAALLQEILSEVARTKRRSLVVDGSLSDCAWFSKLMKRYGKDGYDCEILFVTAPEEKMQERAKRRAKITGRVTDPNAIKLSREKSPQCVTNLSTPTHVRRVRLVDNASDEEPAKIIYDSDLDPRWKNHNEGASVDVKGFVDGRLEQGEDGVVREKDGRKAQL